MELPGLNQLANTRFNVGSFICAAACNGDKDRLEWAIGLPNGGDQLEYRNDSGQTPLHIACIKGHKECLTLLLEYGADLNARVEVDGETFTCLKLAEKGGHIEIVNFIKRCHDEIKQYGDCLVKLKREMITICSKADSTSEELDRLSKLSKVFDNKIDELFDEPLIIRACKAGNMKLIEHLVDNLQMTHYSNDSEGSSMLHIAMKNKSDMRYGITKRYPELLLTVDTSGRIPFHLACANDDIEYVKWLFNLVLMEIKPCRVIPPAPPSTPMKYTGTTSPPILTSCSAVEEEADKEDSEATHDATDLIQDSEQEAVNLPHQENKRQLPTSISSSEVKLLMEDLNDTIPSGPMIPVTYQQHIKAMKLFSVDTIGENVLHIMVKNNYHQLLDYILKTYPKVGSIPAHRDYWMNAETVSSPIYEAITRGHAECLDILIQSIIDYDDPSRQLYTDESLLKTAVIANHTDVIKVLIKHGIHKGIPKAVCTAGSKDALSLLLFYGRVVDMIKGGEQYFTENAATLDWKDYLLPRVEPVWIKLSSDAVDLVQNAFSNFPDINADSIIKHISPSVLDHYSQHIHQPLNGLNIECFTIIQLNENELESVPEELFSLPHLKELDLSSNQIQHLPDGLSPNSYKCNNLKVFNVRINLLKTLPSWLFLLPNLTTVDAYYNRIEVLPTATWFCSALHTLNLRKNKLSQLHKLSNVQDNQLMRSQLDELFSQLEYQKCLSERRSSSSTKIDGEGSSCYEEENDSSVLCNLRQLDLSSNRFTSFPKDLVCLAPKLEKLSLNHNRIASMDLIKDLPTAITTLNMHFCGLKDTSVKRDTSQQCGDIIHLLTGAEATMGYCEHCNHDYLANLGNLSLKDNKLSSLQVAFRTQGQTNSYHSLFPVLSVLDVSNNQLVKVPDHLELLTELSSINLSDNVITVMPCSISQLSQLWVINLDNLHLSNVPNNILDTHSATELKNYLKNLHHKSQPYRRMKLMFVGDSNKGKTSLLMALTRRGKVNHYQDIKLNRNRKPLSTVGVDLGDWEYAKQTTLITAGKKITFMTWDFGGQEEYYATHQCFLSPHALYILVWNLMDGISGLESLRPWLQNIESRAMGAQVIVVGTHLDLWDSQSPQYRRTVQETFTNKFRELYIDCDQKQRRTYPKIMDKLFFVDTSNKDHISRLRDAIYDFAFEYKPTCSTSKRNTTPLLEELVPACYVTLEETVREIAVEMRSNKQIPILTHQEYIERINTLYDFAKMSTTELKQATQFLHEKGILLHYDEGQLSDLYFVDPQWLCSMLAKVIAVPEVQSYHKNGFIGRHELSRILSPKEQIDSCINLMQKFEVLFELDNTRYLIPSLLPVTEHQACIVFPRSLKMGIPQPAAQLTSVPAIPMGSHSNCLVRFFMLPFIPNGMFPRLSARMIATDVIEQVLSSLKVDHLVDDQQLINRPHWRVWRDGITMVWRHIQIFRIVPMKLPLPGIDVVHVIQPRELVQSSIDHRNVYEGDSLMVQVDILPDKAFISNTNALQMATWLLQQAVEQINSVFEDWYEEFAWKRNIDISVVAADPCPHCMKVVYEHLAPDLFAAQQRLVDKPKALQEAAKMKPKKKSAATFSRTISIKFSMRGRSPTEAWNASPKDIRKGGPSSVPSWAPGRLYGEDERVLYLFSVKLSAVAVMEVTVLTCPAHGAITIDQIAPDMIFADLALNMRVSPSHVTQKNYLNEGGFGVIYAASIKLQDGETQEVVIKTYTVSENASTSRSRGELAWHHYQNANSEGRIMASLRHPNILKLVGIALQPIRLLLEFAPLGSLKNVVNRYQDNSARMNRYSLQKVIYQVSSAMEYIHCNKIVYRDLKLANVLVFEFPDPRSELEQQRHSRVLVKLADYGISKQIVPWGMRGMQGTLVYLPQEVILHGGKQTYTNKIDVYAFGMMLSYLFTYAKPFGKIARPLRAYLEAEQRPDMSPKHRPSCQWMYELMCWSWSSKPHHRPSFSIIRQLSLSHVFTRLHYAMRVEPSKHLVSSIAVKYCKMTSPVANDVTVSNISRKLSSPDDTAKHQMLLSLKSINSTIGSIYGTDDQVTQVFYATDYGMVGVVDMQQSAISYQEFTDMKSPVTCMLVVSDNLWVGSQTKVEVYNTVEKLPIALWSSDAVVMEMILLPSGHYGDNEALLMPTKSCTIVIFTALQFESKRLLETIKPDGVIEMDCEIFCALLVPTIDQLWTCTADNKLVVYNPGCYDNPEKYNIPDVSKPCCMATVNEFVLIAAEATVQKWSLRKTPSHISSLNCGATIMEKMATIHYDDECHISSLLGINNMLYAGTRGGAIVAVDVAKMIVHGVMCVQSSPINTMVLLEQNVKVKVTTLKRKQESLIIDRSLHYDKDDDECLLVSFALDYHGITDGCDGRPTKYNIPTMTSQCRYHQPTPTHNPKDLYMLLWSVHPW